MSSLAAQVATRILQGVGLWRPYADEQLLRVHIAKLRSQSPTHPTPRVRRRAKVIGDAAASIVTIAPSGETAARVLYVPGGGYVEPPLKEHWSFIADMVDRLQAEFTVVRYPLAPEHQAPETVAFALECYNKLAIRNGAPLFVMGDSSGGGLALALLQQAASRGWPMPVGLVMISPWLDCTLSASGQAEIEPRDVMLRRAGLLAAARWYAGPLDLADPLVSPLNGPLDVLPPTLLFGAGSDLLVTDARAFAAKARQVGLALEFHEEPGLFHTWPLVPLPFPERRRAKQIIERFVCCDSRRGGTGR